MTAPSPAPGALRAEILSVIRDVLSEFMPDDWKPELMSDSATVDALSVDGVSLDSIDLLTVVVALEYHFRCELEDQMFEVDPDRLTWGTFLKLVETAASQAKAGHG